MTRKRFDREAAWQAFQRCIPQFAIIDKKPCNQKHAHSKESCSHVHDDCRDCVLAESLYHEAYNRVDECVEIGIRQVFSKLGNPDMLDDLRQAARLRLFRFLPKMGEACLNSEHFFRLCVSAVRLAALNEYARLKRQGRQEVVNETVTVGEEGTDSVAEPSHDSAIADDKFERRESRILAQQVVSNINELARRKIAKIYDSHQQRVAAYFVLDGALSGKEVADSVLRGLGVRHPKDLRLTVKLALREAIHEQATA